MHHVNAVDVRVRAQAAERVHEQPVDEHILADRDAVRLAQHQPLIGLAPAVHGLDQLLSVLGLPWRHSCAFVRTCHAAAQAPRTRESHPEHLEHLLPVHLELHELVVVVELIGGRRNRQRRRFGHTEQRDHDLLEYGLVHEGRLLQDHHIRALATQT
jgi:hypothetical protein